MKNLVYFVFAIFMAFVASCTENEDGGNISFSGKKSISSSSEGGDFQVSFTAVAEWSASVTEGTSGDTPAWVAIDPDSGSAGEYTVNVNVMPNYDSKERKAGIVISCAGETVTVTITQKGASGGTEEPGQVEGEKPSRMIMRVQFCDGELAESDAALEYFDNRLSSIEIISRNGSGNLSSKQKTEFSYDNGVVLVNDWVEDYWGSETSTSEDRYVYVLNSDGMIDHNEATPGNRFVYDNGKLTTAYVSDDSDIMQYDFMWNNGNLTSMHARSYDVSFSYSQYLNNKIPALDINWLLSRGYYTEDELALTGFAGLLGKRSENVLIPSFDDMYQREIEINKPEYLLASEDGKEVHGYLEKIYPSEDVSFRCEGEDRVTLLRAETDAIKEVYETTYRFVINFDGYKEEIGGEMRYYDYEVEFVSEEMVSSEVVGQCFYEIELMY